MATEKVPMFVRVDAELKQAVEAAAVREDRSVNAVVTVALKAWLAQHGQALPPAAKPPRRRSSAAPALS